MGQDVLDAALAGVDALGVLVPAGRKARAFVVKGGTMLAIHQVDESSTRD